VETAFRNQFYDNIASNNNKGIVLSSADDNSVFNNTVTGNSEDGMRIRFSDSNAVYNNTLTQNYESVKVVNSNLNNFTQNNLSQNTYGFRLDFSDNNNIRNNTINDTTSYGIDINHSTGVLIENNTLMSSRILIANSGNNNFTSNHIEGAVQPGLYALSGGNTYYKNTFLNNDQGLQMGGGHNTVMENVFSSNSHSGLRMTGSNNIVSDNVFDSNTDEGLLMLSGWAITSTNNVIANNTFSNNPIGVNLNGTNNQIYNNNFIDNTVQAQEIGTSGNIWNLASPIGGNYWNDYDTPKEGCQATKGTSFCKNPYVFDGNQDNIPWSLMFGGDEPAENQDPVCSSASPNKSSLWPANHKMKEITLSGITDPDGDLVSVTVDSITQDEPTSGLDANDQTPDGSGIGTNSAQIRAERDSTGDGRVYEISFTATDGNGGMCSGSVNVSVPISKNSVAVDNGQTFDSTS
jgi:parallel beta-helix repeat protein